MELLALLMLGGLMAAFAGLGGGDDGDEDGNGGTSGDDSLEAFGTDTVHGYGGDDTLTLTDHAIGSGDGGKDTLRASDFATAYGGNGNDDLVIGPNAEGYGGAGDDTLFGAGYLDGGAGNDLIETNIGEVYGGDGDDTVEFSGPATATGGAGLDQFVLEVPFRASHVTTPFPECVVTDFTPGEDTVVITANGPITGVDIREEGGDTIIEGMLDGSTRTYGSAIRLEGVTGFDPADLRIASDRALGTEGTPFTITFDQRGAGSDTVSLTEDSWLDTGAGNDAVTALNDGHHVILTGAGDDSVETSSYGRVIAGAGDDVIEADMPAPIGPDEVPPGLLDPSLIQIDAGAGNDLVTVTDSGPANAAADVRIFDGSGDDQITIDQSVSGRVFVTAGEGADDITMWSRSGSSVDMRTYAGGDSLTLNVGGDQPLSGWGTRIDAGNNPDHRIDIQVDALLTGAVSWDSVTPFPNDPSYDFTSLRIGGVEVARFPGALENNDWQSDTRITITRDVVF